MRLYRWASCMGAGEALADKRRRMIRAYRWEESSEDMIEECRAFKPKPERSLHEFVNKHLEELFGLSLIKSEFVHGPDARPDTLAFDKKRKCFVIFEYKLDDLNRLAGQLLKYDASASEAMKDAYSRVREKNPDKFTTPTHSIRKEGYFIVVSTHFPNDMKERLSKIAEEIHLYEIHLFDGILVLYKIDDENWPHGDHAPIPWPVKIKAPSIENTGLISQHSSIILQLDYNKIENKPVTLHFPDRKSVDFKSWAAVMRNVSQWLYENGHIRGAKQSTLLTEIRPARRYVELANNLFINLNYTAAQMLDRIKKLIRHIGYKPDGFTITYGNIAKADIRSDAKMGDTLHNISSTSSSATSIQDLDYPKIKHSKPTKLYFPDGTSASPTKWAQVMREIAKWMHRHRYIKYSKQSKVLDSNVPTTNKGKRYNNVRLASNLFIKLQYNKKDMLQRVQKLLQDIGHEPANFKLDIEDEQAG